MSKYMILGTDERDVEDQLSFWLEDHRGFKINRVHLPKRETPTLLTRLGGKVPRVSILIDYELSEVAEYKKPSDIAEQFKELQQLRKRVQKAYLDSCDRHDDVKRGTAAPFILS